MIFVTNRLPYVSVLQVSPRKDTRLETGERRGAPEKQVKATNIVAVSRIYVNRVKIKLRQS